VFPRYETDSHDYQSCLWSFSEETACGQ